MIRTQLLSRRTTRAALGVIFALVLASCSGDDADGQAALGASSELSAAEGLGSDQAGDGAQETDSNEQENSDDDEGLTQAVRVEPPAVLDVTNWVARTFMDDERVELIWAPVEGAETYELFRVPTLEADYEAIATGVLEGGELIYEGPELGTIDLTAPPNTFLTYVLFVEVDGQALEPRWTEALTTPDTTPPTPITGLQTTVSEDGVLIEWDQSDDDVEFATYSVHALDAEGNWQYIGGGADETLNSFLDTDPLDGLNRYDVRAVDFHNNSTEPAIAQATVGGG